MALAREETFGPVLSIIPVDDVDDAVRVANDCDYGLAGSVLGRDRRVVDDVVERFATGPISINDALATALLPGLPFGGVRSSGFGRPHGDAGIREFAELGRAACRDSGCQYGESSVVAVTLTNI